MELSRATESFADGTPPDSSSPGVIELPVDAGADDGDEESAGVGDGPLALRSVTATDEPLAVDRLRQAYSKYDVPDRVLALVIVGLARDGYSLEQITDAIVLGTSLPFPRSDHRGNHVCLFDSNGVLIVPAVPIGDNALCADRSIGRSADDAATSSDAPAEATEQPDVEPDDSAFESARYVGAGGFSETGDGTLFGGLGEGGGDDGPASEVLIEVVEFVAGDTLTGGIELLANLNVLGDLDCFYVSYQFEDVALVGDGTQTYAGPGTAAGAFPDEPCSGTNPPGGLQSGVIDIEATVTGEVLTATLSAEGEDEPFTVTATRVDE